MRKLLATLFGIGALGATAMAQSKVSPDRNEIYTYALSMDTVRKIASTQKALQKTHPHVVRPGGTIKNVNDIVQRMQASPEVMSALRANGLAPRDYALGSFALTRAMMEVAGKKMGEGAAKEAYTSLR